MYMILYVLDDPEKLDPVLRAWREIGINNATITESFGSYRRHARHEQIHPRFDFFQAGFYDNETENYTLFALVPNEATVQRCIAATERVMGDLNAPHGGVLAAWPVPIVRGYRQSPQE